MVEFGGWNSTVCDRVGALWVGVEGNGGAAGGFETSDKRFVAWMAKDAIYLCVVWSCMRARKLNVVGIHIPQWGMMLPEKFPPRCILMGTPIQAGRQQRVLVGYFLPDLSMLIEGGLSRYRIQ